MRTKWINRWDQFTGSFWLLPGLAVAGAVLLALGMLEVDQVVSNQQLASPWLLTTADAAQTTLSTIAGAMMTIVGVVFSITMVTFSIAASQYGSRVLRSRMEDRVTQVTLAAFLGTSAYSLVALRAARSIADEANAPNLTVIGGIALALISLMLLIYFIHHVANVIQAPELVSELADDLNASIDWLFPESLGAGEQDNGFDDQQLQHLRTQRAEAILSPGEGYVLAIDGNKLVHAAAGDDVCMELLKRPGDFVSAHDEFAKVYGPVDESAPVRWSQALRSAVVLGNRRTPRQDVNCAVHELSQMAVRALSPGINDPYTAVNCIDRLSAAMAKLAQRKTPSPFRQDDAGQVRVVAFAVTMREALAASFGQIQDYSRDSTTVTLRLLTAFRRIAAACRRGTDLRAVVLQAEVSLQNFDAEAHHPSVADQIDRAVELLNQTVVEVEQRLERDSRQSATGDGEDDQQQLSGRETLEGEVSG